MNKRKKNRIAVFVDASNEWHRMKKENFRVDYGKLCDYVARMAHGDVIIRYIYIGVSEVNQKTKFAFSMEKQGFCVRKRQMKIIRNHDGDIVRAKADTDAMMAMDVGSHIPDFDIAVLVTGDGDFDYAVERVIQEGKIVYIFSTYRMTGKELLALEQNEPNVRYIDFRSIPRYYIQLT